MSDRSAPSFVNAMAQHLKSERFGAAELMTRRRREVERAFGDMVPRHVASARIDQLVDALSADDGLSFRDLRDLSWSINTQIGEDISEYRLVEDEDALTRLVQRVGTLDARRQRRCRGGFMAALYSVEASAATGSAKSGLALLRNAVRAAIKACPVDQRSEADAVIDARPDLLGPTVPTPLGRAAIKDPAKLERDLAPLAVPRTSWFWTALLDAQIDALRGRSVERFATEWPVVLAFAQARTAQYRRALASIVRAYAETAAPTLDTALRDAALDAFGNPMLERNTNDWRQVGAAGTRLMRAWLVENALDDFFRLLSTDPSADSRRVRFWKRYAPFVTDLYIFVGSAQVRSGGRDLTRLRRQLGDRFREMAGKENLFVLRIGEYGWMEFSKHGNACYVYRWSDVTGELVTPTQERGSHFKRQDLAEERLYHSDGHLKWEAKFAEWLRVFAGAVPVKSKKRA